MSNISFRPIGDDEIPEAAPSRSKYHLLAQEFLAADVNAVELTDAAEVNFQSLQSNLRKHHSNTVRCVKRGDRIFLQRV